MYFFKLTNLTNNKKTEHISIGNMLRFYAQLKDLYVKSEQNYVAVLHNVFLALGTHKTLFLSRSH